MFFSTSNAKQLGEKSTVINRRSRKYDNKEINKAANEINIVKNSIYKHPLFLSY